MRIPTSPAPAQSAQSTSLTTGTAEVFEVGKSANPYLTRPSPSRPARGREKCESLPHPHEDNRCMEVNPFLGWLSGFPTRHRAAAQMPRRCLQRHYNRIQRSPRCFLNAPQMLRDVSRYFRNGAQMHRTNSRMLCTHMFFFSPIAIVAQIIVVTVRPL